MASLVSELDVAFSKARLTPADLRRVSWREFRLVAKDQDHTSVTLARSVISSMAFCDDGKWNGMAGIIGAALGLIHLRTGVEPTQAETDDLGRRLSLQTSCRSSVLEWFDKVYEE